MSAEQMILTVLATKLAQAVAKDNDNPDGHDIASGLYGPAVSEWLREVAKELAPAEPVVLECKAGDLKALMRSHYERRPHAVAKGKTGNLLDHAAEQAEPVAQTSAEWERRFLSYDPSSDPAEAECDIPPHGWRCTRTKGHDGPCAAVSAPDDVALVRRSMARLAAAAEQAEPGLADKWRALALQFDRHRMAALSHLRTLLDNPQAHAAAARAFLGEPPPPAPARQEPLTDEQIEKAADAIDNEAAFAAGFYEGARFAERAHGIPAAPAEGEKQ